MSLSECMCAYLPVPHRVDGVGYNGGAPLLAMVSEFGEAAPLPGQDGHFQVWVRIKKHPLLQPHCLDI